MISKEELLKRLEEQISYLSNNKIPGMERADLKQELILEVLKCYPGHEDETKFTLGWWFKKLQWKMYQISAKEKREPVNRAKRYEALKNNGK
jgi:hypothetical protein